MNNAAVIHVRHGRYKSPRKKVVNLSAVEHDPTLKSYYPVEATCLWSHFSPLQLQPQNVIARSTCNRIKIQRQSCHALHAHANELHDWALTLSAWHATPRATSFGVW